MKCISVVTGCFNEEANVETLYQRVKAVFAKLKDYHYEHIFIDNASTDKTVTVLKEIAQKDPQVKIIVNARNFGHVRSPFYGLLQAKGDAVILLAADLQDPPELISQFLAKWELGFKIVVATKRSSQENFFMKWIRRCYYQLVTKIAEQKLIKHFTGFGLYDRKVINILGELPDAYPYFRWPISEENLKHL